MPLRERLTLFIQVCHAVQHAHQKGIIHRDLKPSNVLVTLHDGNPLAKIIDFGIAKAAGLSLTDKTLFTNFAQMIGTPLYMSPEQAALSSPDVDTRSDIYSLGVVLYELLTGTTPFDKERFRTAGFDEMRRIIREEDPPRPSMRLQRDDGRGKRDETKKESQTTGGLPSSLILHPSSLHELDWIVMKCLEKDRNRRYESASALAADVQRYLHDEPVLACPPSAGYRLRKFVRRHQRGLGTALLAAVLLIVAAASVGGMFAWQARDTAARQHETERGVLAASAQAEAFLGEGDKQLDSPMRWQMTVALADGAVQRGEGLLQTGPATPDLVERMRQVRDAVDAARRDSDLLTALDGLLLETAAVKRGHFDTARAAPRYAALLRGYGVDLTAPANAATRVRDSRLRERLLAALDDWRRIARDAADRQRLEALLQAAAPAPDAFRERWLAAMRRQDSGALVELAAAPQTQTLPVAAILNLAHDLEHARQMPAAERLLRLAGALSGQLLAEPRSGDGAVFAQAATRRGSGALI